jgi:hypothetical protein
MTFSSLKDAVDAGFQVFGRSDHGYRMRIRTAAGWVFADVNVDHLKSEGAQAKR